ncbi:tRNA-dependent cyclodipeptide synthase [Nocardia concava]|uniref:tRNA-dependent cyclodipeptide synthase n=1 Tax=Nocardia concava TaxID=257281 RepID=UPI0002D596A3|nr:tRNA-dependent cyclodipeptide synthase [Nocardia concava]
MDAWAVRPLTANCAHIFEERAHACLGISPFNSYFKRARIAELTRWAAREFNGVQFHLPDVPSEYTLRAMGFPADKARRRAHENGLKMRNRIRDAVDSAGLDGLNERILDWNFLSTNSAFLDLYKRAHYLFDTDPAFRALCLDTTRDVLRHRLPDCIEPDQRRCEIAVEYFLTDIPLLVDTPAIVGTTSSLYAYHRTIPFIEALYNGDLPIHPHPTQGYLIIGETH